MSRGITLLEVIVIIIVIIIVIGVLAAILLPSIHGHGRINARRTACANNLSQMWKMQQVYMSQFGGRLKAMPPETGRAFWRALTTTQPPLIDATVPDILLCPVKGDSPEGKIDYGGPARPVSRLSEGDPVGADSPDNHKMDAKDEGSGNVLRKSGDVLEVTGPDWTKFTQDPNFPRP